MVEDEYQRLMVRFFSSGRGGKTKLFLQHEVNYHSKNVQHSIYEASTKETRTST